MDVIHPENQGPPLVKTPTVNTFGIRYLRSGPGWVEMASPDNRSGRPRGERQRIANPSRRRQKERRRDPAAAGRAARPWSGSRLMEDLAGFCYSVAH